MQRLLMTIALAGVLPAVSFAQGYPGRYPGGGRYERRAPDPVGVALRDLQSIASHSYVDHHERNHFRHAIDDLSRFEYHASQRRFDHSKLSNALGHMEHLANARQIHPRDRDIIRGHMSRLYPMLRGGYRW